MAIQHLISPYIAKLITSSRTLAFRRRVFELWRRRQNLPHEVTFFYKPGDPYSHLLLQKLQQLTTDFDISLHCKVVLNLPKEMLPEPDLLDDYALHDAKRLAQTCNLEFPDNAKQPTQAAQRLVSQTLLAINNSERFITIAHQLGEKLWQHDYQSLETLAEQFAEQYGTLHPFQAEKRLVENEALLVKKGHYLSGTLHYGGEWYWGIDRLHYLIARLCALKLMKRNINIGDYIRPDLQKATQKKAAHNNACPIILDFYFSFRSPYSYLALERTFSLVKQYPVKINIKPVLPMVMRGLPVPFAKRIYILSDAKREARFNHIPFGKVCDPLGKGVENCLAIYEFAVKENKEHDYLISVARGIWSEGVNTATEHGLKKLVTRAGLNWYAAKTYLDNERWKARVEKNRNDMFEQGLWGVPCFQLGELRVWGQDRIWVVQNELKAIMEKSSTMV